MSIVGRLGMTPEAIPGENASDGIRYSLATSHGKSRDKTSWFKVAFFPASSGNEGLKTLMLSLNKG